MSYIEKLNVTLKKKISYYVFLKYIFNPNNFILFKLKYFNSFKKDKINKEYWIHFFPELKGQKLDKFKEYRNNNKLNIKSSIIEVLEHLEYSIIDYQKFNKLFIQKLPPKILYQIFLIMLEDYKILFPEFQIKTIINNIDFSNNYILNSNQFIFDKEFTKIAYDTNETDFIFNKFLTKPSFFSYKQLENFGCYIIDKNTISYQNNIFNLKDFCYKYIFTLKTSHFFNKIFIYRNNIIYYDTLVLLFIGNKDIGDEILLKIFDKLSNKIHLAIVLNYNNNFYSKSKHLNKFKSVTLAYCHEYGNDITPSLILYNKLKDYKFKNIFKIHTKSDNDLRNKLIDYILNIEINELQVKLKTHNIYNDLNFIINSNDIYGINKFYLDKYKEWYKIDVFLPYSIFYTNYILMNKIIEFIEINNFTVLFTFNMYDNNWTVKNTPYHFIERLFYMIK